ncbi:MAG: MarR family transcriptional regulator [Bacteroidales bacterium]|nr:MarR family transcriptional regulator [Bacteroidales bacterium]MBN2757969.1 MarR family transcriptional regulator [Bacteroidales bacterium]
MDGIIDLVCELKKKCIESDSQFSSTLNITDSEYNFMKALINCNNLNSKSISKKMGLSLSRVSRIIDKLVKNGYLLRYNDEIDRRTININLTKEGENLKNVTIKFIANCEKRITDNLSEEELNNLKKYLSSIIDIL